MRLIDADDFKKFMQALCKAGAPYESVVELLDKQPTGYDVDKVVDEMEKLKSNLGFGGTLQTIYADSKIDKAIEIVKHGGVNYK